MLKLYYSLKPARAAACYLNYYHVSEMFVQLTSISFSLMVRILEILPRT